MGLLRWLRDRLHERLEHRSGGLEAGSLRDSLVALLAHLTHRNIDCALVGGVALAARGVVRGTRDLDLLVAEESEPAVHELMSQLGFETINRGPSVSSYAAERLRIDFLVARRARGRGMLARAELVPVAAGISAKVVQVEDLVALKLQAVVDNPDRGRDRADIEALLLLHGSTINMEMLRAYAAAMGAERELEEIMAAVAARTR